MRYAHGCWDLGTDCPCAATEPTLTAAGPFKPRTSSYKLFAHLFSMKPSHSGYTWTLRKEYIYSLLFRRLYALTKSVCLSPVFTHTFKTIWHLKNWEMHRVLTNSPNYCFSLCFPQTFSISVCKFGRGSLTLSTWFRAYVGLISNPPLPHTILSESFYLKANAGSQCASTHPAENGSGLDVGVSTFLFSLQIL